MTTRILVLEGPDGSGKSTIADRVVELTGARLVKFDAPDGDRPGGEFERFTRPIKNVVLEGVELIVLDRFYYSEFVYGPHFRGGVLGDLGQYARIERFAQQIADVTRVYVDVPWETNSAWLTSRGDESVNVDDLAALRAGYDRLLRDTDLDWTIHHTLLSTPNDLLERIGWL